jgi:hypothetical protein
MEDYGLRLPVGKSTDRSPHIDRIVNIGLGSRLLSNPASDLGRAAGRPSKDVQRRGHDPPDDPRLSPQARPAFERPGERLLCGVLGRLSPSGEAIRHAGLRSGTPALSHAGSPTRQETTINDPPSRESLEGASPVDVGHRDRADP